MMPNLTRFPRLFSFLALSVCVSALLQAATPAASTTEKLIPVKPVTPPTHTVNITADHQTYDPEKGQTVFNGNVVLLYDNITIHSNEASMEMTGAGQPHIANFYPRPIVRRLVTYQNNIKKEDVIQADRIEFVVDQSIVRASGNSVSHVVTVAADPFTIRADVQQFDNNSKTMLAKGGVNVHHKDIVIDSPRAMMQVAPNGKAEKVVFLGGAKVVRTGSVITSDKMTILVASGDMLAEGNVQTLVQNKQDPSSKSPVSVKADNQQYDKVSDTILASGNVKIHYEDYEAMGPKATFKMVNGQVDKIFLTGRSTINVSDRIIQADRITITINPKNFDALGHVKSLFKTQGSGVGAKLAPSQPAASPAAASSGKTSGKSAASAAAAKKPATKKPSDLLNESDFKE
jgi:lipopolysaccharide export system protein LptA